MERKTEIHKSNTEAIYYVRKRNKPKPVHRFNATLGAKAYHSLAKLAIIL